MDDEIREEINERDLRESLLRGGYRPEPPLNELFTALAKAQGEIEAVKKDREASIVSKDRAPRKYSYADLASMWDAARAPLAKNGLSVVQLVAIDDYQVTITTILGHSSGQKVETVARGMARADSFIPGLQAIGSTITYLRKYAFAAIVGLASEDDDGQTASAQPSQGAPPKTQPKAKPKADAPPPQEVTPPTETEVRKYYTGAIAKVDSAEKFSAIRNEFVNDRNSNPGGVFTEDLCKEIVDLFTKKGDELGLKRKPSEAQA